MSNSSSPPLAIKLRPSPRLALYLLVLYGAAASAPWLARLPWPLGLGWAILCLLLLSANWRSYVQRAPRLLTLNGAGRVTWSNSAGEATAELEGTFVQPWLCVLRLRGQGALLVPADACAADPHRLLRVALLEWALDRQAEAETAAGWWRRWFWRLIPYRRRDQV